MTPSSFGDIMITQYALNNIFDALTHVISTTIETDKEIAASNSYTITDIDTSLASNASIIVNNKGNSTSVEVAVYCTLGTFPYTSLPITLMQLDTTTRVDIIFSPTFCDKLKVVVDNKDTSNATTVDIQVQLYGNV